MLSRCRLPYDYDDGDDDDDDDDDEATVRSRQPYRRLPLRCRNSLHYYAIGLNLKSSVSIQFRLLEAIELEATYRDRESHQV